MIPTSVEKQGQKSTNLPSHCPSIHAHTTTRVESTQAQVIKFNNSVHEHVLEWSLYPILFVASKNFAMGHPCRSAETASFFRGKAASLFHTFIFHWTHYYLFYVDVKIRVFVRRSRVLSTCLNARCNSYQSCTLYTHTMTNGSVRCG